MKSGLKNRESLVNGPFWSLFTTYCIFPPLFCYENFLNLVFFLVSCQVVGCQQRSVTVNTCLGTCLSLSTPTGLTGTSYHQVKSCTCCQPIRTEKVDVGLWCQDNADPSKIVPYYHPIETVTECACASCWFDLSYYCGRFSVWEAFSWTKIAVISHATVYFRGAKKFRCVCHGLNLKNWNVHFFWFRQNCNNL